MGSRTHAARPAEVDAGHRHVTSPTMLVTVFGALVALTGLTVAVTLVDLGALNIWVALAVATAKAALVGLFFMHLLYENRFFAVILVASLACVALFVAVTILDTRAYAPSVEQAVSEGAPAGN